MVAGGSARSRPGGAGSAAGLCLPAGPPAPGAFEETRSRAACPGPAPPAAGLQTPPERQAAGRGGVLFGWGRPGGAAPPRRSLNGGSRVGAGGGGGMERADAPPEGPPRRNGDHEPTEKPGRGTLCSAEEDCAGKVPTAGAFAPNSENMEERAEEGAKPWARAGLSSPAPGHTPLSCPRLHFCPRGGEVTPPRSLPKLPPLPVGSRAGNRWEWDRTQQIK
ncbi:translation initiation factor IF-2-like [Falco biarmicus]|uniref:translation initiation factor IF-2-like n=1 Tax=Falco cherrug TaxID=345164 RepID=UPI002479D806|nr:translation initiation factor IF-2-like [Falco cherrug]XP_056201741.1 translation initiation factor IF-2-like [Falco biarmicus]